MREDIHRPSLLDPAEYEFVAAFYQGNSVDMLKSYKYEMDEYYAALDRHPVFEGNHARKNTCDHCGAAFAHGVLFFHIPTQELIHVGHICAANTVGLPDKAAVARKKAEKYAAEQKARRALMEQTKDWREQHSDLIDWLNSLENPHGFLIDMLFTINKWGKLSEGQTNATYKWMVKAQERAEREAEKAEQMANVAPLSEGRYDIIGEVLKAELKESYYGWQEKMLVLLPDGNKVWGSVPKSIFARVAGHLDDLKGKQVSFQATVTRSDKDEHFGFFKKPTQGKVVS